MLAPSTMITRNLKPFCCESWPDLDPFGSPILEDCGPVQAGIPGKLLNLVSKVRFGTVAQVIIGQRVSLKSVSSLRETIQIVCGKSWKVTRNLPAFSAEKPAFVLTVHARSPDESSIGEWKEALPNAVRNFSPVGLASFVTRDVHAQGLKPPV